MKIIIGLGNPEKKYELTRHNAGFMLVDKLQSQWEFPDFEFNKKFNAEISKNNLDLSLRAQRSNLEISNEIATSPTAPRNDDVLLVKPQTYMNLSGSSVKTILDFYKLSSDDILVIHDDIDIPLGKYKIATDSSSAGHNGVQNIIDLLGTQTFKRARIGIGQTEKEALVCRLDAHDFVLEKFTQEELKKIEGVFESALEEIKNFL